MTATAEKAKEPANVVMPAEWQKHAATWISWPKNPEDWPGKFEPQRWVYAEIVRILAGGERVEIICAGEDVAQQAARCLNDHHVPEGSCRLHLLDTDRSWLRDSAPTAVISGGKPQWLSWNFNGWAKYDDYVLDRRVPALVSAATAIPLRQALRPDNQQPLVLEGGAIDSNGEGTLLATEECLLSAVQERNPGLTRGGYEMCFRDELGIAKVIWLPGGISGDDTHGHIDDVARFVGTNTIVLAFEEDPSQDNHAISVANWELLRSSTCAGSRPLEVIKLPLPKPLYFAGQRLPASYANFYIANAAVLVPTFNDPHDRIALNILAGLFPDRRVVGIHSVDLVLGLGTLHCLTQPQFA